MAAPALYNYGGVRYTRPGENEKTIINKAFAFKETWEYVRDGEEYEKPRGMTDADAWEEVDGFYKDKTRMTWARNIEGAGLDLAFCKESEVREYLVEELFGEGSWRKINKKSTLNDLISDVRGIFRAIGREHDWGAGQEYLHLGDPIVFSGNPMTPATADVLLKKLKGAAKEKEQTLDKEKQGKPVSVVAGYINMIYQFRTLVDLFMKWEDGKITQGARIYNLAMLVLMYAFLLHEGARPGDVSNHLQHAHMFYILHENVYMLTMVFLRPETLAFLWRNNALSRYVAGMYKGKDKKFVLMREKAAMPVAFNSIDLPTIYTICMRICMSVTPEILRQQVFKKGLNLTSLRHKRNKKYALSDLTFYSFRYGAAEEDKIAKIQDTWTEMRMGHTPGSKMKDRYAGNKGDRVTIGDEAIPLGMDKYERATNPRAIKLEFVRVDAAGIVPEDNDWVAKTFGEEEELMADFTATSELVKKYIQDNDEEAKEALLEKYKEFEAGWFSMLPFGMHIKFADQITPEIMKTTFTSYKDHLMNIFEDVPIPKAIPELWSFPQVMYGNWRSLIGERDSIAKEATAKQKTNKRKRVASPEAALPEVAVPEEAVPEVEIDSDDYNFATILHHDHVVIYCKDANDSCALKLPNIDEYVWVIKVVTVKEKKRAVTADITGWFYKNNEKDITKPLIMRKKPGPTINITEDAIVKVYAADDEDFELTEENIKDIEGRWI